MRKLNQWFVQRVLEVSGSLMTWSYVQIGKRRGYDPKQVAQLAKSEENQIWDTIVKAIEWRVSEADILSDRLSRRYDLGAALNEAANRAIAAKKALQTGALPDMPQPTEEDPEAYMSPQQKAAFAVQKQYLQRVIKNS